MAAGSGTRVGGEINKVYLPLGGRPVVSWSLDAFGRVPEIGVLVLVTRPDDAELVDRALASVAVRTDVETVHGGANRQDSELAALRQLARRIRSGDIDTVLIHDAARPLVSPELIIDVLNAARKYGGAIPGLPSDPLAMVAADGRLSVAPLVGEHASQQLVAVQTPQGFRAPELLDAYEAAEIQQFSGTDTASCTERFSALDVRWVSGDERNFKITYPHDVVLAEKILTASRQVDRPALDQRNGR